MVFHKMQSWENVEIKKFDILIKKGTKPKLFEEAQNILNCIR